MPADGTTSIRMPGIPGEIAFGDWIHNREWSTSRFANTQSAAVGALNASAGELQPGGSASLTTRQATMPAGGGRGFPPGYEMYVYSIQLVFGSATGVRYNNTITAASSPTDGDFAQVYGRTLFKFTVQNKLKSQGGVYKYPSGGGMYLTGSDTSNATNRLWSNNGLPSPRDQAAFIIPHLLEPNIPFAGEFSFDAALALSSSNTLDIEGNIEGIEKRPVT
jgi:hypothetical protein